MKLAELRADIPALSESTYLNWGASGPSPRRVVAAVTGAVESHEFESPGAEGMYGAAFEWFDSAREAIAGLLGTEPSTVALTGSTTDGINRVATAIDWDPGDVVVTTDLEHSAGRLPWSRLGRKAGVQTRVVEAESGTLDPGAVEEAVAGARLLCVSALDWKYGRVHPIRELVERAHDHGAMVLVDAVQVPGQRPIDVTEWGADFVVGAGHKWLMGPWGAGFLYVDPAVVETVEPTHIGFRSVEDPNAAEYTFKPDARRFEVGTTSPAPYAGIVEAIETVEAIGQQRITSRIESLTDRFKDGIPEDRLLSPKDFQSGLVTVRVADAAEVVERMAADDIQIRALPMPETVRFSFHAANTPEDVDEARSAIAQEWTSAG